MKSFLFWLDRQKWIDRLFFLAPYCDYKKFVKTYEDDVYLGRLDRFTCLVNVLTGISWIIDTFAYIYLFVVNVFVLNTYLPERWNPPFLVWTTTSSSFGLLLVIIMNKWKKSYQYRKYGIKLKRKRFTFPFLR